MASLFKAIAELSSLLKMALNAWHQVNKENSIAKDTRARSERCFTVLGRMRQQNRERAAREEL